MKRVFPNLKAAREGQQSFRKRYGYRPALFQLKYNNITKYFIVKPKGLIGVTRFRRKV